MQPRLRCCLRPQRSKTLLVTASEDVIRSRQANGTGQRPDLLVTDDQLRYKHRDDVDRRIRQAKHDGRRPRKRSCSRVPIIRRIYFSRFLVYMFENQYTLVPDDGSHGRCLLRRRRRRIRSCSSHLKPLYWRQARGQGFRQKALICPRLCAWRTETPLLGHVLKALRFIAPEDTVIVVGYQKDKNYSAVFAVCICRADGAARYRPRRFCLPNRNCAALTGDVLVCKR